MNEQELLEIKRRFNDIRRAACTNIVARMAESGITFIETLLESNKVYKALLKESEG